MLKQGAHNANRLCTLLPDVALELLWDLAALSKLEEHVDIYVIRV